MEKRMNKKAQDLSIGTLILIVLGIVVLVLLILGFSLGWGNLWEKINIFGGGSSLGDVSQACALAVTSNNVYDYCSNFKQVTVNGNKEYVNCEDTRVQQGFDGRLTCNPSSVNEAKIALCTDLKSKNKGDTRVNNLETCDTIIISNKCTPDEDACTSRTGDLESDCLGGACQPVYEDSEGSDSTVYTSCTISDRANTICAAQNSNETACKAIKGCKYQA